MTRSRMRLLLLGPAPPLRDLRDVEAAARATSLRRGLRRLDVEVTHGDHETPPERADGVGIVVAVGLEAWYRGTELIDRAARRGAVRALVLSARTTLHDAVPRDADVLFPGNEGVRIALAGLDAAGVVAPVLPPAPLPLPDVGPRARDRVLNLGPGHPPPARLEQLLEQLAHARALVLEDPEALSLALTAAAGEVPFTIADDPESAALLLDLVHRHDPARPSSRRAALEAALAADAATRERRAVLGVRARALHAPELSAAALLAGLGEHLVERTRATVGAESLGTHVDAPEPPEDTPDATRPARAMALPRATPLPRPEALEDVPSLPRLHVHGVVLGPSGFAAQGREYLAGLERAGFLPSLSGARLGDDDTVCDAEERALIELCAGRRRDPEAVVFHHMLPAHFATDTRAPFHVAAPIFEATRLADGWAERLAGADLIVAMTPWLQQVYENSGLAADRIVVVPPPVRTAHLPGRPTERPRWAGDRPFRWLAVADWQARKGLDLLLRAFARTFHGDEAELWLKIPRRAGLPAADAQRMCEAEMRRAAFGRDSLPRVHVLDDMLDDRGLAALYGQVDGFALASRGEGWGRPVHEAMLMELPVVVTGASSLETLVPDTSVGWPVPARVVPVSAEAARETPTFAGLHWYEPDVDAFGRCMRAVLDDPLEATRRGLAGRRHVLQLCDPDRIVQSLRQLFARLNQT